MALAPWAPGQEPATTPTGTDGRWRLEHRLENPLLYLSRLGPALVDPLPLLDDPVLQKLLGPRTPEGFGTQGSSALLRPLARLLSNKSEDLELALTKMVPAINAQRERPSLIFRCQLPQASAEQVGKVLRESLAEPGRTAHGQQVYQLKAPSGRAAGPDPGNPVEVVLVDNNLLVSNDPRALDQTINPATAASVRVLSRNTRYKDLRTRIDVPEGAVMLYAHWGRLGPRRPQLSTLIEKELGLPFFWSGLGDTDRLLLVVQPAKKGADGFVTSVLLGRRPKRRQPHWPPAHWPEPKHDGWLQAVEAARPQQLLAGLQPGAAASLAVAVDPNRLLGRAAASSPRMLQLQAWIFGHAFQAGVEVRSQIIRRLDKLGSAQILLLPGDEVRPRVAYSFQAKTGKHARDLIADLKKALANSGRARSRQLDSGKEALELASPGFGGHSFRRRFGGRDYALLAAVGDAVYFTFDEATMEQVIAEAAQASRKGRQARIQRDALVRQYLKHLGAWDRRVAGVFAADLSALASRVSGKQAEEPDADTTRSGLFALHAGYLTVEQDLVRLEVFSPR